MELERLYQDLQQLKAVVLQSQENWNQAEPNGHITGILAKANRLEWYKRLLPQLENSLKMIEEVTEHRNWLDEQ